jgi:hypothetical protein
MDGKVTVPGVENRDQRPWGSVALTTRHSLSARVGTNFADRRRSLVGIVHSLTKATEFSFMLANGIK